MQSADILEELVASSNETREFCGADFEQLEEYWALADARLSAFFERENVGGRDRNRGLRRQSRRVRVARLFVWQLPEPGKRPLRFQAHDFDDAQQLEQRNRERSGLGPRARPIFAALSRQTPRFRAEFGRTERRGHRTFPPRNRKRSAVGAADATFMSARKWIIRSSWAKTRLRDLLDSFALSSEWKYDNNRVWYENELGEFDDPPILSLTLELILQTRDWTHPREGLADRDAGEWEISPRAAFATLAQTIATRDVAAWNAQNPANFNSHWRHWAEIEAENRTH